MSTPRHLRIVGLVTVAALALTACGDDDGGSADATSTTVHAEFPITVAGENGTIRILEAPQRIVSLSPSLTEMLFAVGAGEQVVAVDKNSDFPAGVPTTDLSGFRPNVEAIAGYEPDLVITSGDRDGVVAALEALDIQVLVFGSPDTLHQAQEQLLAIGEATGHFDEAEEVVEGIDEDLDALVDRVADRETPLRYFYELSADLSTVTSDTFIGDVLGLVGLESIADGSDAAAGEFPKLSTEAVLDADPDLIFLAHTDGTGVDPAELEARDGWSELTAVREGRVIVLPEDISTRWGPRIVELLEAVVAALEAPTGTTGTTG